MSGGPESAGPVILALGWSLVHFIWQGAAIGVVCWAVLRALESARPVTRYWVAMAGLWAMAAAPVVTFLLVLGDPAAAAGAPGLVGATAPGLSETVVVMTADGPASVASRLEAALPVAVALWMAGVILMLIRLWRDVRQVNRLLNQGISPVSRHWETVMARLADDLGVRRPVRLLESVRVSVPLVIGWLRPTILIPPSALLGLTPRQLELIIAHELAHVRRADWLFNLFQVGVETVLFYHPAVRLLSRRIRAEREQCCDDIVVAATHDSLTYARALTEVEGLRATLTARMAIGASDGQLAGRVTRLVAPPRTQRGFVQWAPAALLISSAMITAASMDRWPATRGPAAVGDADGTLLPAVTRPAEPATSGGPEAARESPRAPFLRPADTPKALAKVTPAEGAGFDNVDLMDTAAVAPAARNVAPPREPAAQGPGARKAFPKVTEAQAMPMPEAPDASRAAQSDAGPLDGRAAPTLVARPTPAFSGAEDAGTEASPVAVRESASPAGGESVTLPPVVPAALESPALAAERLPEGAEALAGPAAGNGDSHELSESDADVPLESAGTGAETRAEAVPAEPSYTGGQLVRGDPPDFPRRARTRAEGGRVAVAYTIDERGRIQDLEITDSSGRDFTLAVKRALKRWRFEPYALDGTAVARRVVRTFDFRLEAGGPGLEDDSRCGYATASRLCRRYASAGNPEAPPPDPHPVDECDRVTGSRICGRDVRDQNIVVVYQAR